MQWKLDQKSYMSIQENAFENVIRKLAVILWPEEYVLRENEITGICLYSLINQITIHEIISGLLFKVKN